MKVTKKNYTALLPPNKSFSLKRYTSENSISGQQGGSLVSVMLLPNLLTFFYSILQAISSDTLEQLPSPFLLSVNKVVTHRPFPLPRVGNGG